MELRYISMIIGLMVIVLISGMTAVLFAVYGPWGYALPFAGLAALSGVLFVQLVITR